MKNKELTVIYIRNIPKQLQSDTLYISDEYKCAIHLCACGCGEETVTPLDQSEWKLEVGAEGKVSLTPSIGNWNFKCKSHYYITNNEVNWV